MSQNIARTLLTGIFRDHLLAAAEMVRLDNLKLADMELISARETLAQISALPLTPGFSQVRDSSTTLPTVSTVSTIDV